MRPRGWRSSARGCAILFIASWLLAGACAGRAPLLQPRRAEALALRMADAMLSDIQSRARAAELAGTCDEVCALASSICEAADKICQLARDYPAERDLRERCGHAQAHCRVARERCATCQLR